jgi:hypothetical protein
MSDLLADFQPFHTPWQMDHAILGRSCTPWGAYGQALREIHKRSVAIEEMRAEIALLEIDLDEQKRDADPRAVHRATLTGIKLREHRRTLDDARRELAHFELRARQLKGLIGELTPERRDALDREHFCASIKQRVALDLMACGRMSRETQESLFCLPGTMRSAILDVVRDAPRDVARWLSDLRSPVEMLEGPA